MPRAGLTPEAVTEAAAAIVDTNGLAALTLARLAADLGVAPPSLYKHIAGWDDLLSRVTTLSLRRLTDDVVAAVLGHSGRQALLAFGEAYRRFATSHAGLYSLTQATFDLGSAAQQAEVSRALDVLAATIRDYGVPDDLVLHAMRLVRAGLHGFADIEARGGFGMPHSVDESFLVLINALHASLSNLGGRTGNQ